MGVLFVNWLQKMDDTFLGFRYHGAVAGPTQAIEGNAEHEPRRRTILSIECIVTGAMEAVAMRNAATDVTEVVIPDAGHWLMEEQPAAAMKAVRQFLDGK
jgi:pimeloyl-ACP methyl ester carboxylesterase